MIVAGSQVFAIVPNDNPMTKFMREFDPDHVELMYVASEHPGDTPIWWGIGIDCAESTYGSVTWVCPD